MEPRETELQGDRKPVQPLHPSNMPPVFVPLTDDEDSLGAAPGATVSDVDVGAARAAEHAGGAGIADQPRVEAMDGSPLAEAGALGVSAQLTEDDDDVSDGLEESLDDGLLEAEMQAIVEEENPALGAIWGALGAPSPEVEDGSLRGWLAGSTLSPAARVLKGGGLLESAGRILL